MIFKDSRSLLPNRNSGPHDLALTIHLDKLVAVLGPSSTKDLAKGH